MAFDITKVGGYGTSSLGNVTLPYDNTGAYSEYGKVREYQLYLKTYNVDPHHYLEEYSQGDIYHDLEVGGATLYLETFGWRNDFLTVGSATLFVQMRHKKELNHEEVTAEELSEYGKYEVRTITAIDGDYFTFDQAPAMDFANYYVSITPFLDFENLTLDSDGRLCLQYQDEGAAEGILAVRVKNTLTLNGGHIDLFSPGYIDSSRTNLTPQEENGELDADEQAGQENFITRDRFLLSGGQEGGLFLIAKNIVVTNADSRIGVGFAFTHGYIPKDYYFIGGVQYCRGAADSPNRPTGLTITFPPGPYEAESAYNGIYATNKSGAAILIACETFEGFTPALIAKYSMRQDADELLSRGYGYGKGLARCYIACKNPPASMLHDEGLYALDVVTDGDRLRENRVFSYGNGSSGDVTNPSGQINSYAAISGLSAALATLTNINSGSCPIEVGAMVMIHAMAKSEPPENVNYVTLVGAASLSNPHIQTYVEPSVGDDTVPSGEGILVTNTENDILITGTENADTISNEGYDVTINAGAGDDSIYSDNNSYSGAYVTIDGGAGNDTIVGRFGDSSISGGEGNDVIEITGDIDGATINAGTGNDTLYLDNYDGNNVVQYRAGDGDDVIYYFMDGDTLSIAGGSYTTQQNGEDIIVTVGEGHITLVGAANLSELHIDGTIAEDTTASGEEIYNNGYETSIKTGGGNDTIYVEHDYKPTINAGAGNDEIHIVDSYQSKINGGAGNDTIKIGYDYESTLEGGAGDDLISLSSDSFANLIVYNAGDGNDTIEGFSGYDTLSIVGGDYTTQQSGADMLVQVGNGRIVLKNVYASMGTVHINDDEISLGDEMELGDGDNFVKLARAYVSVYAGGGNDTIYNESGYYSTINVGTGNNVVSLSTWDYYYNEAQELSNLIAYNAGGGNNTIYGFQNSDTLSIVGGSYTTQQNGEDIIVTVGEGHITLVGAANLFELNIEGAPGEDTTPSGDDPIAPSTDTPVTHTVSGVLITGTDAAETINNTGSDVTIQGAGDDYIENSGANVSINAGTGDPTIYNVGSHATITTDYNWSSINNAGHDAVLNVFGGEKIINTGNRVLIKGDSGYHDVNNSGDNVTIMGCLAVSNSGRNFLLCMTESECDDNDINGFNETSTLSLNTDNYSTNTWEDDVIVFVDSGHFYLKGAAHLSRLNIVTPSNPLQSRSALKSFAKAKNFASKALTATSAITNSEDNVTIYGTADADTITNSGKDVTIIGYEGNDEIHLTGSSKRNVIVVGVGDGTNTYYNLGDTDTILVSLSGEEYKQEQTAEYVTIRLQNGRSHSEPCSSGNVVSVTGGTLVEEFTPVIPDGWLGNTSNNVSIRGTSGLDSIVNYGSNVTIIPNGGDDVISLSSDSNRNVIVRRFNDGLGEYYGLDGNDTILISLSGGTYWEQRENNFVRIHYGNVIRSEPCTAGNAVSVVGATKIDHPSETLPSAWIVNRADNVSIFGSDENDTIANYGSNCTICGGKGDDTISMASGSNNNVVITGFYSGGKSYIGLNNTDTVLVSLNGGEYFATVETEDNKDYRAIYYASRRLRVPISSGNAVSVTGGIERDYILITNARNGSSIIGGEYPEYIINTGEDVDISCGGGNDTVENRGYACVIDLRSGANVLNNSGSNALIYSSSSMNTINHSGHHSEINFSGSATLSIDSGAKYNKLVAGFGALIVSHAVIYGFNGTTTLSTVYDYTLTESKPDLKINLSYGGDILLKNVYNNTGVIHIDDAAIAIKPDDYTYNYAAGDGDIAISGFDEASTLNVTGNFVWKRYGNDIIVGVSENDTPIIYTGDISAAEYPRDSDFKLAKVLSYSNGRCSLDTTFEATPDDYYLQLISIPQYKNLTLSNAYTGTPKWENGRGGICALAVSDTCNLSGGKLNVEGKGHGLNVGNELDGNAFMRNHLPLGNGHGSIFLLAKNIKMNTATRIGATCSGAAISNYANYGGKRGSRDFGSKQGAHVLIVSDKIEGLNESAISTGGDGAGSGYRGNDGISGAAFICCNNSS